MQINTYLDMIATTEQLQREIEMMAMKAQNFYQELDNSAKMVRTWKKELITCLDRKEE